MYTEVYVHIQYIDFHNVIHNYCFQDDIMTVDRPSRENTYITSLIYTVNISYQ